MAAADIIARLRLEGDQFTGEFRSAMSAIEAKATSAASRVGGAFQGIGARIKSAADSSSVFIEGQRAADRMLASVDPLFAAQMRYNQSLSQANQLFSTGMLSAENYRRVLNGLEAQLQAELQINQRLGVSAGQRRAGMQQLSFQVGDVAQQLAAGTPLMTIFIQQSGQVVQAIQMMGGEGNAFIRFLGSGWGIGIAAAAMLLVPFIAKLFDTRTELQKASDELTENARKAEITRQAHEIYAGTARGAAEAIREETRALEEQNRTLTENQNLVLARADAHLVRQQEALDDTRTELANARRALAEAQRAYDATARTNDMGDTTHGVAEINALAAARQRVRELEGDLVTRMSTVSEAERQLYEARIPIARAEAERAVDPIRRLTDHYNDLGRAAERAARGNDALTAALPKTLAEIYRQRDAAVRAERERQNAERSAARRAERDFQRPVPGGVLSPFGVARDGGWHHQGVDLSGRRGDPVVAPVSGTARRLFDPMHYPGDKALGLYVEIVADDGTRQLLGHLNSAAIGTTRTRVTAGQVIGTVGGGGGLNAQRMPNNPNDGNAAGTNPHVHWQVRDARGRLIDPMSRATSGGAAAQAANQAAAAADREADARARVLQTMEQSTAQAAEQARLSDMRARGLDREAELETDLVAKRQQAAERMEQLRRNVEQLRESRADPAMIQQAEAAVAAQERITNGLQEQLALYEDQSAAYARMLLQHREDGVVTAEEAAAERAAAAAKQETLARAQAIGTTIEDNLQIQLAMVRAEHGLNNALEDGFQLREKQKTAARELQEEQQQALDDMKRDMIQREEDQIRQLADLYGDLFRGKIGDIWDRFKDAGLDVIAQLAAQWTLSMMSGQQFNVQGALQGMGQSGNPIASLLGGLFGGGKGAGGLLGGGKGIVAGDEWWNIFGSGAGGAGAMGGMGGIMSGIGSAMPYIGAAFAAFGILKSLGVFSSTKRGSATLGYSGGDLGAGATRGNDQGFIAASSSAMDSVGNSLERIADMLGGTVTGAGSVSLGQRDGKWRGDPTGRGITKTKKGAIDFGEDQEAAIRWAISEALRDGVISGISDAAKHILQQGKDLEKAIEKASMIESIPKLLKARIDPVGAALDELEKKWAKIIAALKEGGATAEQMADAQKLYKLELEDTISQTKSASSTLKEFLDSLKMGSSSPYSLRQQEENARAALQPFLDKIAAGESINQDQYQQAAQTYLDIERQLYGSTGQFFTAMDEIMDATSKAIARIDSAVPIRTAVDPFVEQTASNTSTMTEQLEVIGGLLGTIAGGVANDNTSFTYSDFIGGGGGFTGARLD